MVVYFIFHVATEGVEKEKMESFKDMPVYTFLMYFLFNKVNIFTI